MGSSSTETLVLSPRVEEMLTGITQDGFRFLHLTVWANPVIYCCVTNQPEMRWPKTTTVSQEAGRARCWAILAQGPPPSPMAARQRGAGGWPGIARSSRSLRPLQVLGQSRLPHSAVPVGKSDRLHGGFGLRNEDPSHPGRNRVVFYERSSFGDQIFYQGRDSQFEGREHGPPFSLDGLSRSRRRKGVLGADAVGDVFGTYNRP